MKKIILFVSCVALLACQSKPTKTNTIDYGFMPPPLWNSSMQNMKQNMITLQPYIFNKVVFNDRDNFQFLSKSIHKLAIESANIKHDPMISTRDPTVRFVASQFADELRRADENFKGPWKEYSRSQLVKVTNYCLECHTRLHQGPSFEKDEVEAPFMKTLPVADQIEFMIAFRQYDAAYKMVLANLSGTQKNKDVNFKIDRIVQLGLLISVEYLKDEERTRKITQAIDHNPSLPAYLKQSNEVWKKSIENWSQQGNINTLVQIRSLVNSRISQIEDMRAISALLQLLTNDLNQDELGEALMLTGQSYEALHAISIMSLDENYYESCIRKTPETKWAKVCLDKLSDSLNMGYSGSGGTRLPRHVTAQLDELKNVIKNADLKK
ncbi:MAG: hypothetical protein H7235_11650 [Bdellovibrionaceae bacterium]|nr:hypothetical protein [Pseudobdellovibrionaceae bacterium]